MIKSGKCWDIIGCDNCLFRDSLHPCAFTEQDILKPKPVPLTNTCGFCGEPIPEGRLFCDRQCKAREHSRRQWAEKKAKKEVAA